MGFEEQVFVIVKNKIFGHMGAKQPLKGSEHFQMISKEFAVDVISEEKRYMFVFLLTLIGLHSIKWFSSYFSNVKFAI